jgi:hypothetical protein
MAVTSMWRIGSPGSLGKVVNYAVNPDKTDNPAFFENADRAGEEWLADVIGYAVQSAKTGVAVHDENEEILRRFVTGVNCLPETARAEMQTVKQKFGKTGGVLAYHGYQSFAPGEVTPETAHEIGVKLADKLWGERHQVVVATHLDKANHLHNHFVVNTVSMVDGIKYRRTERDYYNMQRESDALCREYRLSVIDEPKRGKSKHYAEQDAEREGRPTWRGLVKTDVDAAIRQAETERQFYENLKNMGYEVKIGEDISVRPPGKERFVRLRRNFGEEYVIEAIRRRILTQSRPERYVIPPYTPPKRMYVRGSIHKARKLTGLRARYFYYLYRMGILPKKGAAKQNPKRVYFLFREDIRHMRDIAKEIRLIAERGINTDVELAAHKEGLTARVALLSEKRGKLKNKSRREDDPERLAAIKTETAGLSAEIAALRKEMSLCEDIETRLKETEEKLRREREDGERKAEEKRTKDGRIRKTI